MTANLALRFALLAVLTRIPLAYGDTVGEEKVVVAADGPQEVGGAVPASMGGVYVVYSHEFGPRRADVYLHRVGGSLPMPEPLRLSDGSGNNVTPRIHRSEDGGIVVIWGSFNPDYRLNMQRFDRDGAKLFAPPAVPFRANAIVESSADSGNGVYVLTKRSAGTRMQFYLTRVTERGTEAWTTPSLGEVAPDGSSGYASMCRSSNGDAIVAVSLGQLSLHRFTADGRRAWSEAGIALTSSFGWKSKAALSCDTKGGVLAVWQDRRRGPNASDGFLQAVDASGRVRWAAGGIEIDRMISGLSVADDGQQGAFVAYAKRPVPTHAAADVIAMRIGADGRAVFGAGGSNVVSLPQYSVRSTTLEPDGKGGAFLAWHVELTAPRAAGLSATPATSPAVGMRWLDAAGANLWGSEPVHAGRYSIYPVNQTWAIAGDSATLVWSDRRSGYADVFLWQASAPGAQLAPVPAGPRMAPPPPRKLPDVLVPKVRPPIQPTPIKKP